LTYKEKVPSLPVGVTIGRTAVVGDKLDAAGTSNYFETDDDNPLTSIPTLAIDLSCKSNVTITRFLLESLDYYMNQTAAVTYTLYLFEGASADDVTHLSELVFQSPAAQADVTLYWYRNGYSGTPDTIATLDASLPKVVKLSVPNKLYYTINWSGAPGNTPGFITVRGRLLY
jgi:hypothetical protein